jgi:transposase-like protein
MYCPNCDSTNIVKNGIRNNDKQNYRCQSCGRQFVENPSGHYRINDETRRLVDRLLLERLSLAGIARAAQVS